LIAARDERRVTGRNSPERVDHIGRVTNMRRTVFWSDEEKLVERNLSVDPLRMLCQVSTLGFGCVTDDDVHLAVGQHFQRETTSNEMDTHRGAFEMRQ
jgi:hypothetical protein